MKRRNLAIGLAMGLVPIFIFGINLFEGDRIAQSAVAVAYVIGLGGVMYWGTRATA